MLCLLVGKQSTYFTVSPVTGAGVTRRYWILVAGALGSGRLSPAWHSCGLLGGAPLLPRCTLQGGQPGVKLVWQTPGPHQGGGGPSPLPPALFASASSLPYSPLPERSLPWSTRNLISHPEEKGSSLPRGKLSAFLGNLQDKKFSLRSSLIPFYPYWSCHCPCPLPPPSLGQNSA